MSYKPPAEQAPTQVGALPAALSEPSDLEVAISVARQLLDSDQILSMREALRLLLRALDAEPDGRSEGWTATMAVQVPRSGKLSDLGERCPAAHTEDPALPPADLPQPVRDLFAAIAESLDVPLPSTDPDDGEAAAVLLTLRATHVRILLESLASHPAVSMHKDAADVRAHTERTPVTYRTFAEQKAADQERGERP